MKTKTEMEEWKIPIINQYRCIICGLCEEYCPRGAVHLINSQPMISYPENCVYCGICEDICPTGAIKLSFEIILLPQKNVKDTYDQDLFSR